MAEAARTLAMGHCHACSTSPAHQLFLIRYKPTVGGAGGWRSTSFHPLEHFLRILSASTSSKGKCTSSRLKTSTPKNVGLGTTSEKTQFWLRWPDLLKSPPIWNVTMPGYLMREGTYETTFPTNIQKSAHFICKFRSWGVWGKGFANTIRPIFLSTYYDCEHLWAFSLHECPDFTAEGTKVRRNYLMCPRSNSEWYVRICIHTQVHLTCSRCSRHQESLWHAEGSSGLWGQRNPDSTTWQL